MPKAPRIFVVEDDESIRMLLEVALRSFAGIENGECVSKTVV